MITIGNARRSLASSGARAGRQRDDRARRRVRSLVQLTAILLAAGLIASACSSGGSSGGSSSSSGGTASLSGVTLHVGDQAGTGAEAVLTAAGLIHKLPFKIAWSDFTSGPPMLQAMSGGAVDIGGVGDAPPVFAAAGGDKIAIVGARTSNPLGSAIVVPAGSPIRSVAQLKGKKIAVAQGSSANYHVLALLKKGGLGVKDVTLDYLQPAEALAAFSSGHVDAWDVWSPYIEEAVAKDRGRILATGAGLGTVYSFEVASRAALADPAKAKAIKEYLTVLNQAYQWIDQHQQAWASVWAKATGLPDSIMLQAAKDSATTPVPITSAVVSSEQSISNAFTAAGLIPVHVNFASYSVATFNSTASAGTGTGSSS
jgi:sulfonate transport system substrate-binding protein